MSYTFSRRDFLKYSAMTAVAVAGAGLILVGEGAEQTVDCNDATLLVNGTRNVITALGTCYAVTVMGSGNTVVADTVTHDITVYGSDETVFYHNGTPFLWDRGRELGMVNRLQQVPA